MIKEGDVVVVTGKRDSRIKEYEEQIGTLVMLDGQSAAVLFPDGTMWHGNKHEVYSAQPDVVAQEAQDEPRE